MNKPRILLVLDGIAESTFANEETTLSRTRPTFLTKLTKTLKVGLFDPYYLNTKEIYTDFIIASLAGVQINPWPGRAWLESAAIDPNKQISYAAIIRTYDNNAKRLMLSQKAIENINSITIKGFRIHQRLHERTANSWLLIKDGEPDVDDIENILKKITGIVKDIDKIDVSLDLGNVFHNSIAPVVSKRLDSAVLAHSRGSVLGVCKVGGIDGLNRNGSPMDKELHSKLFSEIRNLITQGHYQNFILYFKATDWASHFGSRQLKAEWLLYIDKELISILYELRSAFHITIISDHRTDIGSEESMQNTSIFATNSKIGDNCSFVEREIEKIWNRPPLTLKELSWQVFPI